MNFNFTTLGITKLNDYRIDCSHEHQTRERSCHTELSMRKHKQVPTTTTGQSLARPEQLVTYFSLTSTQETLGENRGFQGMIYRFLEVNKTLILAQLYWKMLLSYWASLITKAGGRSISIYQTNLGSMAYTESQKKETVKLGCVVFDAPIRHQILHEIL